jgi:hypothetical protein
MNYLYKTADILEKVEKYNLSPDEKIEMAKVYAIPALADAIKK